MADTSPRDDTVEYVHLSLTHDLFYMLFSLPIPVSQADIRRHKQGTAIDCPEHL